MLREALRAGFLLALGPVADRLGVVMLGAEAATEDEVLFGKTVQEADQLSADLLAALKKVDRLEAERDELERLLERLVRAKPGTDADRWVRMDVATWLTKRELDGNRAVFAP